MSLTGFGKVFDVNDSEYAYITSRVRPVAGKKTLNFYVPKIMGAIVGVEPGKTCKENIVINKLFDNDQKCMPTYAKQVTRAKSFAATVKENCNWMDKLDKSGYIPKDTQFIVEFLNGNISTPVITTK